MRLTKYDFCRGTREVAVDMSADTGFNEVMAGHWAEIIAINTKEYESKSTTTVQPEVSNGI